MTPQPPDFQPPELPSPFAVILVLATSLLVRDFLVAAISLGARR